MVRRVGLIGGHCRAVSIVMTRDAGWAAEGALPRERLDMAVTLARDWIATTADACDEIILFGGGEIYAAVPFTNRIEQR